MSGLIFSESNTFNFVFVSVCATIDGHNAFPLTLYAIVSPFKIHPASRLNLLKKTWKYDYLRKLEPVNFGHFPQKLLQTTGLLSK